MTRQQSSVLRRFVARRTLALRFVLAIAVSTLAGCADEGADGVESSSLLEFDSQTDPYTREIMRADLDDLQASADVVDVVAAARFGDAVVQARAGSHERSERDPRPLWDAQFRIGSATKTFTAVVVLQLVAEGVLSLEDTVERWLPGELGAQSQITVRQLLAHTSGLFDYVRDETLGAFLASSTAFAAHRFDTLSQEELVALALAQAPEFSPGTRFGYSNTNYAVLGMIIDAASGLDFRAQIEQRIIAKLGLTHTYVPGFAPYLVGPHLHGFMRFADSDRLVDVSDTSLISSADSGVVSTLSDLTLFFRALVRGELLSAPMLARMQETQAVDDEAFPGGRYGLGLQWSPLSCGGGYWHHAGDTLGYSVRTGVTQDGSRSVGVVMNSPIDELTSNQSAARLIDHALCARAGI